MDLQAFKENIATPIRETIEKYKAPTLAQFNSFEEVTTQWFRAQGMQMALNHIENVYRVATDAAQGEVVQEILPPQ